MENVSTVDDIAYLETALRNFARSSELALTIATEPDVVNALRRVVESEVRFDPTAAELFEAVNRSVMLQTQLQGKVQELCGRLSSIRAAIARRAEVQAEEDRRAAEAAAAERETQVEALPPADAEGTAYPSQEVANPQA